MVAVVVVVVLLLVVVGDVMHIMTLLWTHVPAQVSSFLLRVRFLVSPFYYIRYLASSEPCPRTAQTTSLVPAVLHGLEDH